MLVSLRFSPFFFFFFFAASILRSETVPSYSRRQRRSIFPISRVVGWFRVNERKRRRKKKDDRRNLPRATTHTRPSRLSEYEFPFDRPYRPQNVDWIDRATIAYKSHQNFITRKPHGQFQIVSSMYLQRSTNGSRTRFTTEWKPRYRNVR